MPRGSQNTTEGVIDTYAPPSPPNTVSPNISYDIQQKPSESVVAWSVEASHVFQRSHERLSLIQWIVWFSSPVCGKADVRSDSH